MEQAIVAVVGNPNCGKTTVFNALTGARQAVGNWPGVTVEKKVGRTGHNGYALEIVDLPGTYSLSEGETASEDEAIARRYVASGQANVVLNILDASNLERNLYVTAQLLDLQVPMVIGLNMMDMATKAGLDIDIEALSKSLGCPVVPIIAKRGTGINDILDTLTTMIAAPATPNVSVNYPEAIEAAIARACKLPDLVSQDAQNALSLPRVAALNALEDILGARAELSTDSAEKLTAICEVAEAELGDTMDMLIADARYNFVSAIAHSTVRHKGRATAALSDKIDQYALGPWFGIPIFMAMMYVMFMFSINVGGAFIDFFDIAFGALLVDGLGLFLDDLGAPIWLTTLLANGIGGGIQTVATFIPVIAGLFLFLSILEDSGYMARAAFVMDRAMRAIGLPGKAFVPLVVGFGCTVPAVMAARTLDTPRDRIMTAMMAPFISCGARLPVYVLFAAAFFPTQGQNLVFALYVLGILAAIGTGFMLKKTLLPGETSGFIMELPPYHVPQIRGVLIRTWIRLKSFVLGAGRIIVSVVVILSFANSLGTDMSFGNEDTDKSVLATIGKTITPVFEPMGIKEENWPATVGLFTGIFAKEAVVGTLNALYESQAAAEAEANGETAEESEFSLSDELSAAVATIPENLLGLSETLDDPMGVSVGDTTDQAAVAEDQEVSMTTFGAMAKAFDGKIGAFAYLLLILLYMPCVAAMGAIYRETGAMWATFAALWTTGLGYGAAVLTYQIGTFSAHPASSSTAIGLVLTGFAVTIFAFKRRTSSDSKTSTNPQSQEA